jgi:hypothetical protein
MGFESFLGARDNALARGDQERLQMTQDRDARNQREVGGLMASGDYAGAAKAAYGYGDLRTGGLADQRGAAVAETQRQRDVGAKIGAGDYQGARQDAYGAGDLELGQHIDGWLKTASDEQKATAERHAQEQAKIAVFLKGLPPEQRKAWATANAPSLAQTYGVAPEQIAATDLSDNFLDQQVMEASTLTDMLSRQRQERQDALAREKEANDERHARAMEGIAGRNASTSAYSAQTGRMSYEQRKKAGGFGTPGAGGGWEEIE